MKSIGSLIPKDPKDLVETGGSKKIVAASRKRIVPAPLPAPVEMDSLAVFVGEISKSYGLTGFEPPDDDVLIARANAFGEELPEIPSEWIPRVFSVARREYAPEPKIFHLLKAWREVVFGEFRSAAAARKPKIAPPPLPTEEERFEGVRKMWIGCAARNIKIAPETLEKFEIKEEEIEEERKKISIS